MRTLIFILLCSIALAGCTSSNKELEICIGEKEALNLSLNSAKLEIAAFPNKTENCQPNVTIVQNITYIDNCTKNANTSNSYVLSLIRQIRHLENLTNTYHFLNCSEAYDKKVEDLRNCTKKLREIESIAED